MKRRNADSVKMRRPVKRNKITEGIYGSTLLYLKFVLLWAMVILADYILEFRFEFLWPFWMMLRSVYDSFKYQGLAFSVFFICIALTSDMICFFFIPVQWIFFAASTYVWVQYVWYTDKGICLPTVVLCCALVYVEAALRGAREAARTSPAQLDLCRPFAAHCVGYPVVTLGFGVKSYVGHRMRMRRQREVQAENRFYYQMLRQALPESASEPPAIKESEVTTKVTEISVSDKTEEHKHMNGNAVHSSSNSTKSRKSENKVTQNHTESSSNKMTNCNGHEESHTNIGRSDKQSGHNQISFDESDVNFKSGHQHGNHTMSNGVLGSVIPHTPDKTILEDKHSTLELDVEDKKVKVESKLQNDNILNETPVKETVEKTKGSTNKTNSRCEKKENALNAQKEERRKHKKIEKEKEKDKEKESDSSTTRQLDPIKDSPIMKEKEIVNGTKESLNVTKESSPHASKDRDKEKEQRDREKECAEDLRRTRSELAGARVVEAELRRQLASSAAATAAAERARRQEVQQFRTTNEELQAKVNSMNVARAADRTTLERRVADERRARTAAEAQLQAARQRQNNTKTGDCGGEWCRTRRAAHEAEATALRRELSRTRERSQQLARDLHVASQQVSSLESRCRENAPQQNPATIDTSHHQLASAVAALRERAAQLERSLSAETRIKLDLFSALGEAKRQLEIREGHIRSQEKELQALRVAATATGAGAGEAGAGAHYA